jgi:hypothetical protein
VDAKPNVNASRDYKIKLLMAFRKPLGTQGYSEEDLNAA